MHGAAATGKEGRRGCARSRALTGLLCAAGAALATASPLWGQVRLTQDEALKLAFPDATRFERTTAYLDDAQSARVEEMTGEPPRRAIVTHYLALHGQRTIGVAYFDVHRVRTLNEVLLIAVDRGGRVVRVEIVAFAEPPEYVAPDGWLELFGGLDRQADLSMKGDVPNLTGATLTARAVKAAVDRTLAIHEVIDPVGDRPE